jgi:nitrite reductase (NO-forming)
MAVATVLLGLTAGYLSAAENETGASSNAAKVVDPEVTGVETSILAQAPNVPPPITRKHAAKVIVNLEVREVMKRLADGVEFVFWTFGGDVPGSFIRIREGDQVEFHLNNHQNNKMPHNIDLHAVTGPGGGAASSFTAPGHSSQFSFKALNAGLYVYHCATAPVGMHVGNGMYGLILVEPKEGLPPVDREYYVMQGEFYTTGVYGEEGLQQFDMTKAVDERPPYVVFNGAVGSLVGDRAITAKVGEKVRLFVGNGGPNLTSSFHVIGEIFDTVYAEGGTQPTHNVQTTVVPPGGAAMVEFRVDVPGTYILVDHAIFRAFDKGALGMLKVDGPQNMVVYSGKEVDANYLGQAIEAGSESEKRLASLKAAVAQEIKNNPKIADLNKEIKIQKGKQVYLQTCFVCHQPNGQGVPEQIPPLARADFLMNPANRERIIRGVLLGQSDEMVVNGKTYKSTMIPLGHLTDEQVANVLTYARNSWGNSGDAIAIEEVSKFRKEVVAPAPRFAALKLSEATPLALGDAALTLALDGGRKAQLALAKLDAVALAAVRGLAAKPVLVVDLLLGWGSLEGGELRCIRLRSDRFDPRKLAPAPDQLGALRAFVAQLVAKSGATPLGAADPARADALTPFADAASYEREVLEVGS